MQDGWYKRMPENWYPPLDTDVETYFQSEWDGRIYAHESIVPQVEKPCPTCGDPEHKCNDGTNGRCI